MKRIIFYGILFSLPMFCVSADDEPQSPPPKPAQSRSAALRAAQAKKAAAAAGEDQAPPAQAASLAKKQFLAMRDDLVRQQKSIYKTKGNPSTLELTRFRRDTAKLAPPDDITLSLDELQKIADALRLSQKMTPSRWASIKNVPEDCMAHPRCPTCNGHGKVSAGRIGSGLVDCLNCEGRGMKAATFRKDEPMEKLVFDPTLAREAFQLRLDKIGAWLILAEAPE